MKNVIARTVAVMLAGSALSGCGTINTARYVDGPAAHYVDARQRAIIFNPLEEPKPRAALFPRRGAEQKAGEANTDASTESRVTQLSSRPGREAYPAFRSCSEPSPDVFTALALSLGVDLGLAPSSATDTVKVATALSESAATISRTQTINLLRESFFRTCERFLNDSQMTPEMLVQAARDQRMMVSVLAIEQLTGSVTPPPVRITTTANATVSADAAKMMERLDAAKAQMTSAESAAKTAEKKAADTASANGCADIAGIDAAARTQPQKEKWTACEADKKAATEAREAATSAKNHYEAQRAIAGTGGALATTASGQTEAAAMTGSQPTSADRAAVANVVERIVKNTFDVDEYTMLCVRTLSNREDDGILDGACMQAISDGIRNEQADRTARAIESRRLISETQIGSVLSFVAPNGRFSSERRDALVNRLDPAQRGRATFFSRSADIAGLREAWNSTDDPTRSLLAAAAAAPPNP